MSSTERKPLKDGTDRTRLPDGTKVGKYTVEFLAAGGMSVVYKGTFRGEHFVLKEVDGANTIDVPSLMSEKSLLERLDHPGLLNYVELLNQDGYYYLVVEYVDGEPLSKWLDSDAFAPVDDVVDWGVQLAEIFDYLHHCEPPIIYRDLKPGNILLCEGRVRLIDFGIARIHKGGKQKDTTLFGSVHTASPEHYGRGETDPRSDIYTLGMTLYLLLTGGSTERVGTFQMAPIQKHRAEVSDELAAVIEQAIQIDPEDRFGSALEFRDALLRASGRPVETPLDDKTQEIEQQASRSSGSPAGRSWLLAAIVLIVLGVGGAAVSSQWDQPAVADPTPVAHDHDGDGVADHSPEDHNPYGGTKAGLEELNIPGDIFVAGVVHDKNVVLLGEDVGLFQISAWAKETAPERSETLVKRLNTFYHQFCPICGKSKLEPEDIKVGRYTDTKDVTVFYAHQHEDGKIFAGPILLATVTDQQATDLKATPRFLASYWRDLLRDTVQTSRGLESSNTILGQELHSALERAREELKTGQATTDNLGKVLHSLTGKEAFKLRTLFMEIPNKPPSHDEFQGINGYEQLKN